METPLATEFPGDNPLLGAGSAWVCTSPRGRALPTRRRMILVTPILLMPEGAVPPPYSLPVSEPASANLKPKAEPAPTPVADSPLAPSDSFQIFLGALAQSLLGSGQTRAAAVLPALFAEGDLQSDELSAEALQSLRERGIVERGSLMVTARFRATAQAWQEVLNGTSDDLAACGDTTLDGWSSELLCALSAAPIARAGEYRRELRKRGVAAFGLIAA